MSELISREDALKWCHEEEWHTPDERWRPESEYGEYIKALPTVDTDLSAYSDKLWKSAFESGKAWRRKGEWIYHDIHFECSKCHCWFVRGYLVHYNYCPNCGADMRGEENE